MGKLALDVNGCRAALVTIEQRRASAEDAHAAAESVHIKSVRAAQAQMGQLDVAFVSPAIGGPAVPDGIH
eukprot:11186588-Lingulodinium_polyedra.AAC.1